MLLEFSLICARKSDDLISFQNRQMWRNLFESISDFGDFQEISAVVVIAAVDSRLVWRLNFIIRSTQCQLIACRMHLTCKIVGSRVQLNLKDRQTIISCSVWFPHISAFHFLQRKLATMKTKKNRSSTWHLSWWWRETSHANGLDVCSTFIHCRISVSSKAISAFGGLMISPRSPIQRRQVLAIRSSGAIETHLWFEFSPKSLFSVGLNCLFSSFAKQMLIPLRLLAAFHQIVCVWV
jgi:hypothetical protein